MGLPGNSHVNERSSEKQVGGSCLFRARLAVSPLYAEIIWQQKIHQSIWTIRTRSVRLKQPQRWTSGATPPTLWMGSTDFMQLAVNHPQANKVPTELLEHGWSTSSSRGVSTLPVLQNTHPLSAWNKPLRHLQCSLIYVPLRDRLCSWPIKKRPQ